jgi:hypothetical protein
MRRANGKHSLFFRADHQMFRFRIDHVVVLQAPIITANLSATR